MITFINTTFKNKIFAKFLLVGLLNTLFGYSIFATFIFIGFHYTIATLMATVIGILFNFKTTGTIVFKINKNSLIIKFVAVYSVIYVLNISCLKILSLYNVDIYIAGLLLIIPMAIITFLLHRHFVFNAKSSGSKIL